MPSLDFVADLTDKFKSQSMDYVIVMLQKGKSPKLHLFYSIPDLESVEYMKEGLLDFSDLIIELYKKYSKNPKSKKRKKKDDNGK